MSLDRLRPSLAALVATVLALLALGIGAAAPAHAADDLVGTFRITPGACSGSTASGSYFKMILHSGTQAGPFLENNDSTCADHHFTLLAPGTDGGLVTGADQPAPTPGFDGNGNSLAARIIRPVRFYGVDFAASTNPTDLQTHGATATPSIHSDGGKLSGDLSAFAATWNNQSFNQGSPKPGGSRPGLTTAPTGTYDASTGHYSLTWTSQIVGGPFDQFTGVWHLEGTFVAAGATGGATTGGAVAPASGGGSTATTVAAAATDGTTQTTVLAASGDAAAPTGQAAASAGRVHVHDDGFQAPVWLVVLLAALGIAGVVALLLIGGRETDEPVSA